MFGRCDFRASTSGFEVRRSSFLGVSRINYTWDQIDAFTEVIIGGRCDRDLAMICNGCHVALDYHLPKDETERVVEVLTDWLKHHKRANPSLEPTPITPVRSRFGFRVGSRHWRRGSVFGR